VGRPKYLPAQLFENTLLGDRPEKYAKNGSVSFDDADNRRWASTEDADYQNADRPSWDQAIKKLMDGEWASSMGDSYGEFTKLTEG
jgi:hypothetical protein